jgi:hypothetical protein
MGSYYTYQHRRARQEVSRHHCCIEVVCMRERRTDHGAIERQIRCGRAWVTLEIITAEVL